ncbi:peptidoglycan D,D-transpeptidase FtsI family protein [Luteolibacter sp. Populi]|uniref:peptidoglycan D,D-transpeptidase FtsI family protein n=1 Tax=Luteolibacter sp. Populi TaxID=3230487 RepID=UPI0034678ACA
MTRRSFQTRCLLLCSATVAGLSLLSLRLFQIQVWDRKQVGGKANAFDRAEILPGLRGNIVDRNDEVLAKSMPVGSIYADINLLTKPKEMATPLAFERVCQAPDWEKLDGEKRKRRVLAERLEIVGNAEISGSTIEGKMICEAAIARYVSLLARPLGMKREELRKILVDGIGKKTRGEFPIAKNLPDDVVRGIQEIIDGNWFEGITIRSSYRRWYTSPDLATHVIGYTGELEEKGPTGRPAYRQIGKFGIEASLEEYLAGRDGYRTERRDAYGMRIPGETQLVVPPRAGLDVQLTLDMGIQSIVEEELDAGLAEFESKRGCAIVMDPKTGEILGMASRPHFNLNTLKDVDKNGYNFALQAIYEPGSTIKVVAAGAALNERLVSPQTSIFCHNGYYQQGKLIVTDDHPQGSLTVEGVLQKSSNIGAFKLAQQLGMDRFYGYMGKWGYGHKTGILLSGESRGVVRNTGNLIDFSRASFGYSLAVTPLQVASAYCVIASDGKLRKPHIVKAIVANDGKPVQKYEPEVVDTVLRPETAKAMRKALERVTGEGGTAKLARVPGYLVCGKTGTAVRIDKGHYQPGHYTVSFAGMMPAADPAFVCVVVIDDPLTRKIPNLYGGTVAAPIFAKIGSRVAAHLNLTPTEPVPEGKDKLAGTHAP